MQVTEDMGVEDLTPEGAGPSMETTSIGKEHGRHPAPLRYGGQVSRNYKFWTGICNNKRVLKHIGGISIPLTQRVVQHKIPRDIHISEKEKEFIHEKIKQLLISDCIEEVPLSAQGWISNVFL